MTPLLAHRLVRNRERSFESVYRDHVRDVYGFSLSILGNPADAEDVTQTTFLNAYRALNRGERIENLRAWLLAIAHNVCRQRFRSASRRPQEVELDPEVAEAFHDDDAPTATEIRNAVSQLTFNQRTVVVLREIEGLSYEEIGETMGISLSAVETLLFRARQALREQLEAADNDLGCEAVERLISLQLDGKLSRPDRRLLRAHLRSCAECAKFARSQRARKKVMPGLVAVPLPAGLSGAFDTGTASFLTAKAAVVAVGAALVGTGTLVSTGVVSLPGRDDAREQAAAAAAAAPDAEFDVEGTFASVPLELARDGRVMVIRKEIAAAKAQDRAAAKQGDETSQTGRDGEPKADPDPADDGGALGGIGGVGGGGGGGTGGDDPLAPVTDVTAAVNDTIDGADDKVDEADDKVPALPESPTVEAPPVPSVDDVTSLP
ncbi:MAG: sigma-70 family RNA polymerase sigma factor [Actinomycetota bacterium]|nr:sigma-70 family RNA polymerase sigma factor [Actinomycetota bacterium]